MRFSPLPHIVWGQVVWCALLLTSACLPKQSCELTKTCEPDAATTSAEATSSASVASSAAEAGVSSATTTITTDATRSSAPVVDAAMSETADAHVETPTVVCTRSVECTVELPYCDDAAKVCTACREARDCKDASAPYCLVDVAAAQYNRCVECLGEEISGEDDCSDGVCVDYSCVTCNLATNDGCSGETPVCVNIAGAPACVACDTSADCEDTPATPTCSDHVCKACSTADPSACPGEQPVCVEEPTSARCVECTESSQCQARAGDAETSVCVQEQCSRCVLGTAEGCSSDAPYCAALIPGEGDAGVEYLSPGLTETPTANQYLDYEHTCLECVSSDDCGGSRPSCIDGTCVECSDDSHCDAAEASICDVASHTCVGCQTVGDCTHIEDTKACDTDAHVCVECTRQESSACDGKATGGFDATCVTIPSLPDYGTCVDERRGNATQCIECVSDAQCLDGFACVPEVYDAFDADLGSSVPVSTGKFYCMAIEAELGDGEECISYRPFVGSLDATSEGGQAATYCRPRYATCAAYSAFGNGPDTIPEGQPAAGAATCFSSDSCGVQDLNDGYCVSAGANVNLCTYACLSDLDCPGVFACDKNNVPNGVLPGYGVCPLP